MSETCFLSGLQIPKGQRTKEHVVPKSKAPLYLVSSPFNIQPAIRIINNIKGDLFLCQWEDLKVSLCYTALQNWHLKRKDKDCIIEALGLFEKHPCTRNPCKYCIFSIAQEYCYAREELAQYRNKWLLRIDER